MNNRKSFNKLVAIGILLLILFILILAPFVTIFVKAFSPNETFSLGDFWQIVSQSDNLSMVWNSVWLGILTLVMSSIIALPLAFIFAKTDFIKYKIFDTIFLIPFMTPPFIAAMGWILFMQRRGLLQQLLPFTKGSENVFFSLFGLVLVMSLHNFPFMYTMLKNALLNVPTSLEEGAAVFGADFKQRLKKVIFPLITGNYAIGALLVFVKVISEYGTPATLGKRIGYNVFTTEIHRYATVAPISFGTAAALTSILVTICLLFWMGQTYITNRKTYHLISGKGSRPKVKELKGWARFAAWVYVIFIVVVAIGIPIFSVLATSLINLRGYGLRLDNLTLDHYAGLFATNKAIRSIYNSFFLAITSATIATILGTGLVLVIRQKKNRLAKSLEAVALLPEMVPGIVLILGIMIFWNRIYNWLPLYNTMWILVIAYVALYLPYAVQYVSSAYGQINPSLKAAGRVFAGKPFYIFRRITLPLIKPGMMTGWMMIFIISFRELVTASLIAPPNQLVISTFIVREFEQGSVSTGMAMAVICILLTTGSLLVINRLSGRLK